MKKREIIASSVLVIISIAAIWINTDVIFYAVIPSITLLVIAIIDNKKLKRNNTFNNNLSKTKNLK